MLNPDYGLHRSRQPFTATGPELWKFAGLLVLALYSTGAYCGQPCLQVADIKEIAPGVYVRPGVHGVVFEQNTVANIGFIVGKRCVAVIDTGGSLAEGQALRCAILGITSRPVCYVINTHVHPDHLLGNLAFKEKGVTFVGHHRLERALALLGLNLSATGRTTIKRIHWDRTTLSCRTKL